MEVPSDWDDMTITLALSDLDKGIIVPGMNLVNEWTAQMPMGLEDTLSWLVDHVDDAPDVGDMIHAVAEHIKREKLV